MEISRINITASLPGLFIALVSSLSADEGIDFFEAKIRPVLVEHCYECHNSVGKTKETWPSTGKVELLREGILVP